MKSIPSSLLSTVLVAAVSITLTGGWPRGLAEYAVGITRRQAQLLVYAEFLSDETPRLSTI